jgi:hypothetical protein
MEYQIDYDAIMAIVKEKVSKEAAQAYSEDGSSLYDGIRMTSRDIAEMKRIMPEVLAAIKMQCNRFIRHVALTDEVEGEPISLLFELELSPRRAVGKEHSLATLFRSMAVNYVLNKFFVYKNLSDLASKYDAKALADVQSLNKLLFEKLPPVYPAIV